MKIPKIKRIKIGSTYYDVKYVDDLRDERGQMLFGRIYESYHLIKVNTNCSYQNMLQTLRHEGEHGIMWEYGVNDKERLVTLLSNGHYAFMIDNPELIREILKHTERMKK